MKATKIPKNAAAILEKLESAGYESYVVGGCVRDALLGREPNDWDICTAARPEETKRVFRGERIIETGLQHGTVTVVLGGEPYEITTFRSESDYTDSRHPDRVEFITDLRSDLARRDFTVNAMAYSPARGLADCYGGERDLRDGVLRCVGEPEERFTEDALRILRALRFAARYGFTIEEKTARAMTALRSRLQLVSEERIFSELCGILIAEHAGDMLRAFPEIVFEILPELSVLYGMEQFRPENHIYDVWEHTLHAVDAVEREKTLRLAMLFHDCGKKATFTRDPETGEGRFWGHPAAGAEIANRVLYRLRCDNETRDTVCTLIEHHEMRTGHDDTSLCRLCARIGADNMRLLFSVRRADARAHAPAKTEKLLALADRDEAAIERMIREGRCIPLRALAVRGDELLALGLPRGPRMGETLRRLHDAVLSGELENEKTALLRRAEEMIKEKTV